MCSTAVFVFQYTSDYLIFEKELRGSNKMKILLLILTCLLIIITGACLLLKGKLAYKFRVAFYYGIFFISMLAVIYLLILKPEISCVMYFTLSVIEMFMVGYLFIVWDIKKLRNKISKVIIFISVWWTVAFILYFIFN